MKQIYKLIAIIVLCVACSDDNETLPILVQEIKLNTENNRFELTTEGSLQLEVIALPTEAIDKEQYQYTFISNDKEVFDVSEQGIITPNGVGEAILNVVATNNTDLWASAVVKVNQHIFKVEEVVIPKEYKELYTEVGNTINLSEVITVLPEKTNNPLLKYESSDMNIAIVNQEGMVEVLQEGDVTISIKSTDGSNITNTLTIKVRKAEFEYMERTNWSVTASHPYFKDNAVGGSPDLILDGDTKTCMALVKPGKSLGGVTVGADDEVSFTIDLSETKAFNAIKWTHRTTNTSVNLRVSLIDVYGSNSTTDFELIGKDIPIQTDVNESELKVKDYNTPINNSNQTYNYRYLKVVLKEWNKNGNTMQISEVNVGTWSY